MLVLFMSSLSVWLQLPSVSVVSPAIELVSGWRLGVGNPQGDVLVLY